MDLKEFKYWAASLYLLNLFDMVSTLYLIDHEAAIEVNPIAHFLIYNHLYLFVLAKVGVFFLAIYYMVESMDDPVRKIFYRPIQVVTIAYFLVGLLHVISFTLLIFF